jgi:hypothetical protein
LTLFGPLNCCFRADCILGYSCMTIDGGIYVVTSGHTFGIFNLLSVDCSVFNHLVS